MAITHAPKCQHQQQDGTRCGRPARRRLRLCDFHHRELKRTARRIAEQARQPWFESIDLDDPKSVQKTLSQITHRLLSGEIDKKRAGQLLHKLQMATVRTNEDKTGSTRKAESKNPSRSSLCLCDSVVNGFV